MRRFFALLLCGLVLLSTGCAYAAVSSQRGEGDYELFFREADLTGVPGGDALRAEIVHLEEEQRQDPQEVARILLTALLEGPTDETLCSTIPAGTTLLSLELDGSLARVDLSAAYRSLSGISLALADYSIAMTLTQLREIAAVTITVRGQQLAYRDKQTFSERDVLLSSNEDVVSTVTAALYFPDQTGKLVPEERTLDLYEGDTQADAVVRALAAGPLDESLSDALPEGFRVQSIWVEDDICYVNLPSAALEALPEWTQDAIHDALIDLAAKLEVKNATLMWPVRIAAAGKLVTPGGAVEICHILGREETLRRLRHGMELLGA